MVIKTRLIRNDFYRFVSTSFENGAIEHRGFAAYKWNVSVDGDFKTNVFEYLIFWYRL
jgi:hypothetical protein